jgi:hypothetical protein
VQQQKSKHMCECDKGLLISKEVLANNRSK